jgi:DNA-binding PadR family transcriptional regulator
LYPILHRLERDKRIEGAWDRSQGRKRKVYGLTRTGRAYLTEHTARISEAFEALEALLGSGQ